MHCVLEEKTCNLTLIMRKWKYRSLPDIITCGYRFIKRNGWCNMKPCSRRLLISCDLNQNELVQTRISEACFSDLTQCANDWHVIFMLFFCMLCWESVYFFFFLCRPQFTCHGITKTLKSFVMFIMRDQWHWSTLKHHWLFFFFHLHQHYTVIFCWFKECIFSFNVTPTLVIITVLSSCSCINIRLIFVCNTL